MYESGNELKMSTVDDTYLNQMSELQLKIKTQSEEIEILKARKDKHPSSPGTNYYTDVKRFERHLKMLHKRILACKDDDKLIKLMNCHAFVSGKKKEFGDQILHIAEILKEYK